MKQKHWLSALWLASTSFGLAHADDSRWTPTDGEVLAFDVFRKGDKAFGRHEVRFARQGDDLVVTTDIDLRAGLGPFTVFRYEHDAKAIWREGQLYSLSARTLKDGDERFVEVEREDDTLVSTEGDNTYRFPLDIIPSTHWNIAEVMGDPEVILSSETGAPLEVEVEDLGVETITAAGAQIEAHRYRLKSNLTVDLWYDAQDRWVKCAFDARGQSVTYVLAAPEDAGAA